MYKRVAVLLFLHVSVWYFVKAKTVPFEHMKMAASVPVLRQGEILPITKD